MRKRIAARNGAGGSVAASSEHNVAERMPKVVSSMAEAVVGYGGKEGVVELFDRMEKGEVASDESLGKFAKIVDDLARVGGAYSEQIEMSSAEQMRLYTAFDDLIAKMGKAGFEEGQANIFKMLTSYFKDLVPLVEAFGGAWKYVGETMRVPMGLLSDFSFGIGKISEETGIAKEGVLGIGTAIAGAFTARSLAKKFPKAAGVMGTLLKRFGWFAVLEDLTGFMTGRESFIGKMLGEEDSDEVRNKLNTVYKELGETLGIIGGHAMDAAKYIVEMQEALGIDIKFNWVENLESGLESIVENLNALQKILKGDFDPLQGGSAVDFIGENLLLPRMRWLMPDEESLRNRAEDGDEGGGLIQWFKDIGAGVGDDIDRWKGQFGFGDDEMAMYSPSPQGSQPQNIFYIDKVQGPDNGSTQELIANIHAEAQTRYEGVPS